MSLERNKNHSKDEVKRRENEKIKFWFATGGAGFCISRALAIKMISLASNGKFVAIGDKIRFPDDVTLGFIVEYLLKVPLTVVNPFHSHLERMDHIEMEDFRDQVMVTKIVHAYYLLSKFVAFYLFLSSLFLFSFDRSHSAMRT